MTEVIVNGGVALDYIMLLRNHFFPAHVYKNELGRILETHLSEMRSSKAPPCTNYNLLKRIITAEHNKHHKGKLHGSAVVLRCIRLSRCA